MRVKIEDDGCGFEADRIFEAPSRHYGLIGMRERAERLGGHLSLTSAPGQGTHVELRIPWVKRGGLNGA